MKKYKILYDSDRDNAIIKDKAKIYGNVNIFANATIGGSAICDNAVIHGKSEIGGDVFIADSAEICGGAKI